MLPNSDDLLNQSIGQRVIVCGASKGIGRDLALLHAKRGDEVRADDIPTTTTVAFPFFLLRSTLRDGARGDDITMPLGCHRCSSLSQLTPPVLPSSVIPFPYSHSSFPH